MFTTARIVLHLILLWPFIKDSFHIKDCEKRFQVKEESMTGDGNSAQIIPVLTYISSFYWKVGGGMTTEMAGDSTSHG